MRSVVSTILDGKHEGAMAVAATIFMIQAVRASHKYGFNLDEPTAELLGLTECIVVVDGDGVEKAGVALVQKDGEIKCLCGKGGVFDELVTLAKAAGGTWLTVYDLGWIVDGYKKHGFTITKYEPFDEALGADVPRWVGTPHVATMELA